MSKSDYKPDCGYGWIVVFACFSINFIMAGLARVAGVMYIALIDTFAVTREVASTPFSLRFCIRCMSGPLVGALGQRYGIRPVVLVGGVLCGVGGMICSFAPDVTYITFAWGVVHGVGYGMCNIIHVIVLNQYFEKYRGVALGIALSGDCFGTFILPILLEYLLPIYDLKGTFLILAAISLNVVPAAILLKPPSWDEPDILKEQCQEIRKISAPNNMQDRPGIENQAFVNDEDQGVYIIQRSKPGISSDIKVNALFAPFSINSETVDNLEKKPRIGSIPNFCIENQDSSNVRHSSCFSLPNQLNLSRLSSFAEYNNICDRMNGADNLSIQKMNRRNSQITVFSSLSADKPADKALCQSVIQDNVHSSNIQLHKNSLICIKDVNNICNNMESYDLVTTDKTSQNMSNQISSNGIIYENLVFIDNKKNYISEDPEKVSDSKHLCNVDSILVSKSNVIHQFLMTNIKPIFLLISATFALYVFLFIAVFTIIIDYASDNGIPTEFGKYLIVSFSITDLFGKVGFGLVLDKNWIGLGHYAGLTTGLMGFFILVIPFSSNFIFCLVSFTICGFIQGGTSIMYPLLTQHYMDKNEESLALGCLNFYGGLLMLPIPPMIGYFRDVVGSYDGVFWTTGGLCVFAGCLWLLEPCLVKKIQSSEKCNALNNSVEKIIL